MKLHVSFECEVQGVEDVTKALEAAKSIAGADKIRSLKISFGPDAPKMPFPFGSHDGYLPTFDPGSQGH